MSLRDRSVADFPRRESVRDVTVLYPHVILLRVLPLLSIRF
jgi:hypothetical protein